MQSFLVNTLGHLCGRVSEPDRREVIRRLRKEGQDDGDCGDGSAGHCGDEGGAVSVCGVRTWMPAAGG
ncbi:MAG: hypothetical protein M0P70_10435 [Desulfobulbaceae bacterium]|nr:hypothetical protein [Desulfobulbaceae bacterium]